MNLSPFAKSLLTGLAFGIAPPTICYAFYFITSFFTGHLPGSVLSYSMMGLYAMSSLAVFITAVAFIVYGRPIAGAIALFLQIAQLVIAVGFLSGV